ncbi:MULTISPECIES: GAF domain-containing protein [unclassified Paenibacillus]|uniref:GAF domain-containing protein n=1 Tax=unclassified Paenibacillus TaxID=185978 RepID=UPI001C0F8760|nr:MULTISPECIES: GAF domain-containing protein [unclassified Paenibacillus]MBU5442279.1 GAF domain-containing protein [Paenibacillus sp. MSJ-34]CAH0121809.1 Free methionine-R-sulfoxide reductase [Paenibacillus sp. CECT 9249]
MFQSLQYTGSLEDNYETLLRQLDALLEGETSLIANLANASALLNQFLNEVNWVGFYLTEDDSGELVLGPFQGLPACVRIPYGKGVCGTAAAKAETIVVADVHAFPGHIACDAASRSEIVVPLIKDGKVIGVLDIDSPIEGRFQEADRIYLEKFAAKLLDHLR